MSPLWWGLLSSVFVAIIIMVVAFVYTRKKVKRMRSQVVSEMSVSELQSNDKAPTSPQWGKLDYDLKKVAAKPLDDESLLFVINTALRNSFKTCHVLNAFDGYEEKSLQKFAGMAIVEKNYDLALLIGSSESASLVGGIFDDLAPKGLIMISNIKRNTSEFKSLMSDLKYLRYRHEFQPIGSGMVIIAK